MGPGTLIGGLPGAIVGLVVGLLVCSYASARNRPEWIRSVMAFTIVAGFFGGGALALPAGVLAAVLITARPGVAPKVMAPTSAADQPSVAAGTKGSLPMLVGLWLMVLGVALTAALLSGSLALGVVVSAAFTFIVIRLRNQRFTWSAVDVVLLFLGPIGSMILLWASEISPRRAG